MKKADVEALEVFVSFATELAKLVFGRLYPRLHPRAGFIVVPRPSALPENDMEPFARGLDDSARVTTLLTGLTEALSKYPHREIQRATLLARVFGERNKLANQNEATSWFASSRASRRDDDDVFAVLGVERAGLDAQPSIDVMNPLCQGSCRLRRVAA